MSGAVDIEELERLLEKATPGPWELRLDASQEGDDQTVVGPDGKTLIKRDAKLMVALRNTAPSLMAELKRLRGSLAKAVAYLGTPSDGELDDLRLRDGDAIDLTIRVKVGDIRELHAALNPTPQGDTP